MVLENKSIIKKQVKEFSVLMSLYINSSEKHFNDCINSIIDQKIFPNQIVIVLDGPISFNLNFYLEKTNQLNFEMVKLEKNVGLGLALNKGFEIIKNELIFRVDTDDILHKDRFLVQYNYMTKNPTVDVLGSNMTYINFEGKILNRLRNVPLQNKNIRKFLLLKNSLNHPTIVYRKSVIESVKMYTDVYLYEDWFLWWKLSRNKSINFHNLNENLVFYRINSVEDRKGIKIAKIEYNFYCKLYKNKFINFFQMILALSLKIPIRLMPGVFYSKIKNIYDRI